MSLETDFAAKLAADLIDRTVNALADKTSKVARGSVARLSTLLRSSFQQYLKRNIALNSATKTLISPETDVQIASIFASPSIARKKGSSHFPKPEEVIDADGMLDLIKKKPKIILTAIAGSGKSILMKYLFLSMAKKRFGRVPLFLELRNLNDISTPDIFTYMYALV